MSERSKQLRAAVAAVPPDKLRSAAATLTEDVIRALPGPARPVANQLKRSKDPNETLRRLPNPLIVSLLADSLSDDCLEATRDALGDAADDPTKEQLLAALETVLETHDVAEVRVTLAVVANADAEASDLCHALLAEDARFAIPQS